MKLPSFVALFLVAFVAASTTGCAVLSKGRTQPVTVRSNPEGATVIINGEEAGKAPLTVKLKRSGSYMIELRKPGFANVPTVVLPVGNEYANRFLRWGLDYDLGATTDLTPGDLVVDMKPALDKLSDGDMFQQMAYRVLQADALFATNEISSSDHKFLVAEIVKFYTK